MIVLPGDFMPRLGGLRPVADWRLAAELSLTDKYASIAITHTRASDGRHFNSSGTLVTATTNAARFDHNPPNDTSLGIRSEEPGTNVCLQSNDLSTTWTVPGGNTTITTNAGTAADGTSTADDVKHGDSAETIQQTITATDNTVYTISAVVQQGTTGSHDWVKMSWLDESAGDDGFEAWFDLSTGNGMTISP